MATFITRIELHSADSEDYDRLHKAMDKAGFSRFIKSSKGQKYHLPTAEYWREAESTRDVVYKSAEAAAKSVGKKFSIITSETKGSTFDLPLAE